MHKDEASRLFGVLGDPTRVKMLKVLYNNEVLPQEKFSSIAGVDETVAKWHLAILVDSGMFKKSEVEGSVLYSCDKELVDTLMSFVTTRCKCCDVK